VHYLNVAWKVDFHDSFVAEYHGLPKDAQNELLACVALLGHFGPLLGRPRVDNVQRISPREGEGVKVRRRRWRLAFRFRI
jgi:hypothetical protein